MTDETTHHTPGRGRRTVTVDLTTHRLIAQVAAETGLPMGEVARHAVAAHWTAQMRSMWRRSVIEGGDG